jgi:hypothetical protein
MTIIAPRQQKRVGEKKKCVHTFPAMVAKKLRMPVCGGKAGCHTDSQCSDAHSVMAVVKR